MNKVELYDEKSKDCPRCGVEMDCSPRAYGWVWTCENSDCPDMDVH